MKFYTYFSNQQRLAVVGLILVIVFLEVLSILPKSNGYDGFQVDLESYLKFQNEITQQIVLNEIKSAPKIYPFNPNFITDYKGYKLGMNSKEINRLLLYRAQNKWINSAKEFQNVTKVSDSFLHIISLNFKFPDWVKNSNKTSVSLERPISFEDKIDLNITTVNELQKVYGVGSVLSNRIIKLRDSFKSLILGANPPSSPTATDKPFFDKIVFNSVNISAPALNESEKVEKPIGIIMHS